LFDFISRNALASGFRRALQFDLWQFERHDDINIALLRKQLGQVQVSLRVAGDLYEPAVLAHCGYAIAFDEHGEYCLGGCG